jgi:hypothetical protein
MDNVEQQADQARQQAAQAGFSGTAHLGLFPNSGIIKLKISTTPPEKIPEFVKRYAGILTMSLSAMNIEVEQYTEEEE